MSTPTTSTLSALSRRGFLGLSVGAVAGSLVACGAEEPSGTTGNAEALTWWDHNVNLQKPNKVVYDAWTAESGVPVEYTYHQTAKIGQALQLAKQSGQTPDVHSNAGLGATVPALIADDWFAPIEWDDTAKEAFGEGALIPGLHVFDGEVYTFPIFADRQYWAANWFNAEMLSKAGVDPMAPPETYDDFRAVLRTVADANGGAGWISPLSHTPRLAEQVNFLAQAAGFPGYDGTRYDTGEIAYDHEAYVTVIEFLRSLQTDQLLFPGSSSLDDQTARVRWAAGAAAFYFDGPWCSGTVQTEVPQFLPQVGVGPMLRPESGTPLVAYRGPSSGNYFISGGSDRGAEASELLAGFSSPAYGTGIADAMAQPPYDLSVVEGSSAIEPWKRLVRWYDETVKLAPVPVLRNPDLASVQRFQKEVRPGLGEIIQGVFSGDVTDVRAELKRLTDASAADREQAVNQAKEAGAEVDLADWGFSDWESGVDYDAARYDA